MCWHGFRLYYGIGCCNTLQHTATHCNTLQHAAHYNTLQHKTTHCNTLQQHHMLLFWPSLQYVAGWRSALQCLQCVAVCGSARQCVIVRCSQCVADIQLQVAYSEILYLPATHVAVCCSVQQCVAVCCSVLQCVAVCCSVL